MTDLVAGLLASDTPRAIIVMQDENRAQTLAAALRAGRPESTVVHCPASDTLPGDSAPPSPVNVGARIAALHQLREAVSAGEGPIVMITTGEACARLYPPPDAFDGAPPVIRTGDRLDIEAYPQVLESLGYFADERVDEPGEYCLRGQILEIYPADSVQPVRIEVSDGAAGELRLFDPITQRSEDTVDEIAIGRVSEPDPGDGCVLLDHLPDAALLFDRQADRRRRAVLSLAADTAKRGSTRALTGLCSEEAWSAAIAARPPLILPEAGDPPPRFVEDSNPLRAFRRYAAARLEEGRTLVLLGSARDLRFLTRRATKALQRECVAVESWQDVAEAPPASLLALELPLPRGFAIGAMVAVAAADLLGSRAERGDEGGRGAAVETFASGEIRIGDVVVHEDFGVAVIEGIEALADGEDAIVLRHAGDARRLLAVAEAGRLWRYGSDEDAVALDKLDGSSWEKRREALDAALAETARELTALAAQRAAESAPVLEPDPAAYERFVAGFPFTETIDQTRAIEAVRSDLASGKPMDRLIIGDVGFGKTEVALRAAAIAALSGYQVALAAPTTVLARQHYESFARRFADSGIAVAALSRFSTAAEKREVKAGLADGSIGVVVGTGGIAAKGIGYARLGLVILDEEQRFGAADKARLRGLGAGHMLTLSATPIPRTLQNALIGLQPMSVIATPPARRQPIRTTIGTFDDTLVRTALLRERARGGQSFLVVPRIEDLAPLRERIERLVPELDLVSAHGKMPAAELDEAMVGFADGDGDVLIATNIIEAGLDVPRANTMIICRADRFGLSQLHQLRGRVGRGARRGRVLLLTDPDATIAARTLTRLNTLAAYDRLGAGFAISARDLDMRGAGDLLGEEQAGHAKLIGVDLYQHLLAEALRAARGERVDEWLPALNIGTTGALPADWIGNEDLRVTLYAELARAGSIDAIDGFEEELIDRFGELPEEAALALETARIRVLARAGGIARIDAGPAAIALTPRRPMKKALKQAGLTESGERFVLKGDFANQRTRNVRIAALLEQIAPAADLSR